MKSKSLSPNHLMRTGAVLIAWLAAGLASASGADTPRTLPLGPEGGRIVIETRPDPAPARVFFSAAVEHTVRLSPAEILGELRLKLRVVQGRPELLTLGLSGDGEVVEVMGTALRDWSVRQGVGAAAGQRFLDLRPLLPATTLRDESASALTAPQEYDLVVRTRLRKPTLPGTTTILLATPGDAVGFSANVVLQPDAAIDFRVISAAGLTPLMTGNASGDREPPRFFSTGSGRLEVNLAPRGAAVADAELVGAQLVGRVNEAANSVAFQLRGQLRAQKIGARLRLLSGSAALSGPASGEGWHTQLVTLDGGRFAYDLVAERGGLVPMELTFAAVVRENGDWRTLDFAMPAGAVVPLRLEGLEEGVSFKPDLPVVPATTSTGWQGFLPADGAASLAWKRTREKGESALAFTSIEQTEVRLGAGLLRQSAQIGFRILQGKLESVRLRVEGAGEILGVEGANIVGWKVLPAGAGRVLEVRFSRPVETQGTLTIQSQAELGSWPVRAEPLRLTPEGGVRHSGFVRMANHGAVRLEVAEVAGMMQLAPAQFPGGALEGAPAAAGTVAPARQVFVYRFPSANYSYRLLATQIQPEIGVSEIATYELAETARVINASLELDVREAPLREWSLRIPEDYSVVALTGGDVADYVAEAEATGGTRVLRILFGRVVEGRVLLQLRLEKNQAPAAGDWALPALQFPGVKSVRGHVGAVATPGFRLAPARVDRLVEVPLSLFPRQTAGLQQAWRVREPEWVAELRIEALGQSVQADVFHLYSLKEGVVLTSVLLNYFVVGAPATEWRIEVPTTVGNIDVVGQNVRRDWRREGDQVIVSLHQPVLGAATLLVTFEQPMSARGGVIAPGQVRPLGVQSERGFLQVVSPLQVKHDIRRAEGGLLKLEPAELPAEFRTFTTAPSLAVYQYTARPFAFEMGVEWYEVGETVDQVVDFARLASQVSRDGQVVTEAHFFVKTRGRKALRLVLPSGAKLWEARVDNELVNARADGSQTLVPLPARANPNEPVMVALRLGQPGTGGSGIALVAPLAVAAPTIISEWLVRSDTGRLLVPQGGNAEPVAPSLTETGFEWIAQHGMLDVGLLFGAMALGSLLLRSGSGWKVPTGLMLCSLAMVGSLWLANRALVERRANRQTLTYAATVVPAGGTVALRVANLPGWRAMIVVWGVAAAAVGAGLLIAGGVIRRRELRRIAALPFHTRDAAQQRFGRWQTTLLLAAVFSIAGGLLAQRGGAVLFFGLIGFALLLRMLIPGVLLWRRERVQDSEEPPPATEAGPATVVPLLALLGLVTLVVGGTPSVQAQARPTPANRTLPATALPAIALPSMAEPPVASLLPDGSKPAQSAVQTWSIRGERLFGELELTVRGVVGDSFLLLKAPAVLTDFKGDGLRVTKVERDGRTAYYVAPEREGTFVARVRFELAVPDRTQALPLPTGPAATQRVTLELDQAGWEVVSPMAVQVVPTAGLGDSRSGATLVLAPHAAPVIRLQPKRRDISAEAMVFFAEATNLFLPGPGVVNGFTRVRVRPVQGRVSALEIVVPQGLTVGEVGRGPVGAWRFDPQTRRLHVAVEPAQATAFQFDVETQLGAGELPFALTLEPLRTLGAAGDVGMLALGFGGDAQPESIRPAELSAVNVQDFEASLLPRTREGQPIATVQQVWRYGPTGGRVELKVAPVAPEVRVTSRQVLSLDDDRMVMAVDLRVSIARVGLFKLSFPLPEGLEVEALSGPALSQWTEAAEGAQRIVTLQLNGRTIGEQAFNLTLAGAAPRTQDAWSFPRLLLREATRQTSEALIVPGKGIRLRAADRERVTQLDPRTVGGLQPGTLAFRLLQDDWVLRLGIETLEAWITAQSLTEVTVREGQTLTRIGLRYRVENAAVKQVQVRLPGLGEESARTLRATGSAVRDMVRVAGTADVWEIGFQRGIAGETDVQIEFQGPATPQGGPETIVPPEFPGVKQVVQFVAVRGGGRLELEAGSLPRGWTRVDWSGVPAVLQSRSDRTVPALCFRVAEPEGALAVTVRRHDVAEALKLRVTQGNLITLFAPTGAFLTAVDLTVEVLEKSTLRVRLPAGARLFNTLVNGESVAAVREGDAWLFYVSPSTAAARSATVRLVYAAAAAGGRSIALAGPSLSVPLENVSWRVVIPPGYQLDGYSGGLRLHEERHGTVFGIEQYQSLVSAKRSSDTQQAVALLNEANLWLQKGEQDKAGEALSRAAANSFVLDEASNEDARVQLRNLKTQQAVLGLNTRRQRLYLDNRAEGTRNDQLEQAANLNPFMQGKYNFDPRQVDQLLMGNTVEENSALRGIATRIVDQQLAVAPPTSALDLTIPERGQVLTFTRSLQVDGAAALELRLNVAKITYFQTSGTVLLWGAFVGAAVMLLRMRPSQA